MSFDLIHDDRIFAGQIHIFGADSACDLLLLLLDSSWSELGLFGLSRSDV